jgi:hypothetical protein
MINLRIMVDGAPFFASRVSDVERLRAPLADLLAACRQRGYCCLILADYRNTTWILGRA